LRQALRALSAKGFCGSIGREMLTEPTSLANVAYFLGDTLREEYGIDPEPLYKQVGIDIDGPSEPGDRISNKVLRRLWRLAADATDDAALGITAGRRSKPGRFFVVGHVWLASSTLADAIQRLIRYEEILDSGITDLAFEKIDNHYVLSERYPNPDDYPGKLAVDMGITSLIVLCEAAMYEPILPVRLELMVPDDASLQIYDGLVDGPVRKGFDYNAVYFRAADMERPLPGSIPVVVEATSRIAERYIDAQVESKVAHQVRERIVQMLPSGAVDQDGVAAKLHCSASTLQRQLSAEGTSYREVLASTRRRLAEAYLREGRHSHSQIAFLVGFSDQSNFARAFKRWTGMSPGQFQKQEQHNQQ
jgi:AraC-like DNA-binding protein